MDAAVTVCRACGSVIPSWMVGARLELVTPGLCVGCWTPTERAYSAHGRYVFAPTMTDLRRLFRVRRWTAWIRREARTHVWVSEPACSVCADMVIHEVESRRFPCRLIPVGET